MIEDRLTFDDGPITPAPLPHPVPAPKVAFDWDRFLPTPATLVLTLVLVCFIGWEVYRGRLVPSPTPIPTPTVDATKDGAAWAKELPLTFADSFAQAQADIRGTDKPLDKIKAEHVERWKTARDAAFSKRFVATLDKLIAPGNASPSPAERQKYAEVMGQIVAGTREGAK